MRKLILVFILSASIYPTMRAQKFDIQGHRGCRGLMPENTLPAFIKAVELGVTTLEMDLCITADGEVVVSHEPWLNADICKSPEGEEFSKGKEKSYNLFRMEYKEIKACDCGSKGHPKYPEQEKIATSKPLLKTVIDSVEQYVRIKGLAPVHYNLEIKRKPDWDENYCPPVERFVEMALEVIRSRKIESRTIIQSFDLEALRLVKAKAPTMTLALLAANSNSAKKNVKKLGFDPEIYSPYHMMVGKKTMKFAEKSGIKVVPWTVNKERQMRSLIELGVNGIITDYPDRLIKVLAE